jgi:hypothetical protein
VSSELLKQRGDNMKIKSICVILILAVILAGGCLESGIGNKYINSNQPTDYIELDSDGTFFVYQKFLGSYSGTYEVKDDELRLIFKSGSVQVCKIKGNTFIDPDGEVWKEV